MASSDCFVGADTGTFKLVDLKDQKFTNVAPLEKLISKEHGIVALCFGDESQSDVLALQKNGQINIYSSAVNEYKEFFSQGDDAKEAKDSKSIQMAAKYANELMSNASFRSRILTARGAGIVNIWDSQGKDLVGTIDAGDRLNYMVVDPNNPEVFCTGGKENLMRIWDMERRETVWTAKNGPQDSLRLRKPYWETNARFVLDSKLICATTGHHQIRLYDPNSQRRPIRELCWSEEPIRALSTCHRPGHVIAGNSKGEMALFDLRGKIRPIHKFRGAPGSVRSIEAHPTDKYVASVGIHRFILIHDIESKKTLHKIYLKAQLNSVLFSRLNSLTNPIKDEPDAVTQFFGD